ncbi:hypothetical protein EDB89DRAFT_1903532 [Lactarius sanguifluus]|nr:hypothetical protein EDB89DRAFT_1903532 [Lactarius sanguifluus]
MQCSSHAWADGWDQGLSGTVPDVLAVLRKEAVDTSTLRPLEIRRMEALAFMANGGRARTPTALNNTPRMIIRWLTQHTRCGSADPSDTGRQTRPNTRCLDGVTYSKSFFDRGCHQSRAVFAWIGDEVSTRCWSTALHDMFPHVISTEGGRAQEEPRMAKGEGTPARLVDSSSVHHPERSASEPDLREHTRDVRPELACGAKAMEIRRRHGPIIVDSQPSTDPVVTSGRGLRLMTLLMGQLSARRIGRTRSGVLEPLKKPTFAAPKR